MRAARSSIACAWTLCLLIAPAGCGDDAAPAPDAGSDTGPTDSGADAEADAGSPDAGRDAGPPPACDLTAPLYRTLAPGFDGTRDEDPTDFAAVTPAGPWAFAYHYAMGGGATRESRVEVRVVDGDGAEVGRAELASGTGDTESLASLRVRPAAGGLLAVWARSTLDDTGRISSSEVHHAGIGADGSITRPDAVLFPDAAAPFLASEPPDAAWVLRSDITMVGMVTGVQPRIQRVGPDGTPDGPDVDLGSYLRVEATEVLLRTAPAGLKLVFRVPPSTAFVVPLSPEGTPMRPERMTTGVPFIDDVATDDDRIAMVWTETVGGMASLGLVLTDGEGYLRQRVALDSFESTTLARIAVVRAWPGFVAVWRVGSGADAALRTAGVTTDGDLRVPPADLVATPDASGDLFISADAGVLTLGSRAHPAGMPNMLALARACIAE